MAIFTLDQGETNSGVRRRESGALRAIRWIARIFLLVLLIIGIGFYFYYQSLKSTPQYSLALLIDAAKTNDQAMIDSVVNVDAVVDDFVPQITSKAAELYGRGLSPAVLDKLAGVATPVLPAVKERARAELPRLIRDRVERLPNAPFVFQVLGAGKYLDITVSGDTAVVKSKLPEHPLELKMKRNGDRWQVTGVKDEQLATDIARRIGQQIIAIAKNGLNSKTADTLGVGNMADLLRQAEELVR
ncbi:MAG TPA: hypothetical protein VHQ01_05515 [Pyrinomonadaceae bacterium]|nr:hypothetical protein [Pyrinomonadaceae bacterium]